MINKAMIDKMLSLDDDRLVMMLKMVLSGAGIDLSSKPIDKKTIPKLRALLSEITDDDLSRIMFLADRFKNGG